MEKRDAVLIFLINDNEILLAESNYRNNRITWNGVSGFINAGEKPKEAAVRELYDSVKIRAYEKDLEQAGVMNLFTLRPDGVRERTLTITIFICENFQGVPHMTSGFKPRWFNLSSIPYNDMFEDTKEWLGRVMSGEKVVIEIISTTDEQTNITKVKDVLVRNIFEK